MRLLLVEPNRINADIYSRALTAQGCEVFVAHQAEGAIHLLDTQPIDLVILELQLSHHNGVEFIYELRSYPEWQNLPIIVHSLIPEYRVGLDALMMKKLGILGYMYKPNTSIARLVSTVEDAELILA